jgi:hypothetical protein
MQNLHPDLEMVHYTYRTNNQNDYYNHLMQSPRIFHTKIPGFFNFYLKSAGSVDLTSFLKATTKASG